MSTWKSQSSPTARGCPRHFRWSWYYRETIWEFKCTYCLHTGWCWTCTFWCDIIRQMVLHELYKAEVVSSNPTRVRCVRLQSYMIKIVSVFIECRMFSLSTLVSSPNKDLTAAKYQFSVDSVLNTKQSIDFKV